MNSSVYHRTIDGITFGAESAVTESALHAIVQLIKQRSTQVPGALLGRQPVVFGSIPGLGKIVVKHYGRGGLLGRFVHTSFLRLGKVRSAVEFDFLREIRAYGISAPEPLVYASRGRMLYEAWLVMSEIENQGSLAELAVTQCERLNEMIEQAAEAVRTLIEHKILHIDLHPGNVLVDAAGHVSLIDFDQARRFQGTTLELREYYLRRWRRAVLKHGLPEILSELFGAGLRRTFAER